MTHYCDVPEIIDRVMAWSDAQPIGAICRPLVAARVIRRTIPAESRYRYIGIGSATVAAILQHRGWVREWDGLHKVEQVITI